MNEHAERARQRQSTRTPFDVARTTATSDDRTGTNWCQLEPRSVAGTTAVWVAGPCASATRATATSIRDSRLQPPGNGNERGRIR